jgi:hypothetical protein
MSEKLGSRVLSFFESEYKGIQNSKGGIVGMLEVIESDFVRLHAEYHDMR